MAARRARAVEVHGGVAPIGAGSAAIFTAMPTALVVDDDPVARQRLKLLLVNLGVQVRTTASVAEGLRALQEDIGEHGCVTFTRIFCDIVMPEASGDALLGLLTSSGWPCSIVMVTGNASEEERQKCETMGATAVLSKPVRKSVIASYFAADATRDGRQMPGRPAVSVRRAAESSQLANALLVSTLDRSVACGFALRAGNVPSWTVAKGVGKARPASAPRLRGPSGTGDRGALCDGELDWTHTSTAVHALAMGAALALAVHVEAGERDAALGPTGQAAEDAKLFEEQRAPGEEAPRATPERIYRFLMVLIIKNHLDMAVAIVAVVFLERAARRSQLQIGHSNWKSLLLTAIIVASKAHYDEQVWVEDFVTTLRMYHLSAPELHRLEMALLRLTDYGTLVRQSTFTLYSLELVALHHAACPFCAQQPAGAGVEAADAHDECNDECNGHSIPNRPPRPPPHPRSSADRSRQGLRKSLDSARLAREMAKSEEAVISAAAAAAAMPVCRRIDGDATASARVASRAIVANAVAAQPANGSSSQKGARTAAAGGSVDPVPTTAGAQRGGAAASAEAKPMAAKGTRTGAISGNIPGRGVTTAIAAARTHMRPHPPPATVLVQAARSRR